MIVEVIRRTAAIEIHAGPRAGLDQQAQPARAPTLLPWRKASRAPRRNGWHRWWVRKVQPARKAHKVQQAQQDQQARPDRKVPKASQAQPAQLAQPVQPVPLARKDQPVLMGHKARKAPLAPPVLMAPKALPAPLALTPFGISSEPTTTALTTTQAMSSHTPARHGIATARPMWATRQETQPIGR